MQLLRTKGMLRVGYNIFSERKEKENLSLSFALWRSCSYLCILKFPNNQLHMKKKHLTDDKITEIYCLVDDFLKLFNDQMKKHAITDSNISRKEHE